MLFVLQLPQHGIWKKKIDQVGILSNKDSNDYNFL